MLGPPADATNSFTKFQLHSSTYQRSCIKAIWSFLTVDCGYCGLGMCCAGEQDFFCIWPRIVASWMLNRWCLTSVWVDVLALYSNAAGRLHQCEHSGKGFSGCWTQASMKAVYAVLILDVLTISYILSESLSSISLKSSRPWPRGKMVKRSI